MTELITKAFECRSIDEGSRTADFVASTDVIDAHGEIIDQSSWQLADFIKNPVILFAHESREFPIGMATDIGVRNGQLECRIEFMPEEMNPKAEQVWKMVRAKFLRAVSVGFIPSDGRYEVRDGSDVFVWRGCVLKEISITPVPANPEALAKMKGMFTATTLSGTRISELGGSLNAKGPDGEPQHPKVAASLKLDFSKTQPAELRHPEALSAKDSTGTSPGENNGDVQHRKATDMDIKEVQDRLEKANTTLAEVRIEAKTATERADKAEKLATSAEAQVKTLETEKAAFDAQAKSFLARAEKAEAKVTELEAKTIDQEVDALVGVKITAAEKPLYVDLRKQSPELFAKMIAQRDDMKLLKQIVAPTKAGDGVDDIYATMNGGAR